jgi:hypothetical protein
MQSKQSHISGAEMCFLFGGGDIAYRKCGKNWNVIPLHCAFNTFHASNNIYLLLITSGYSEQF